MLVTREVDNENHLRNKQKSEDKLISEREKRRMEELQSLEEKNSKMTPEEKAKEKAKRPPEFGSTEDFMLTQAIAYLSGNTVIRSKSKLE